MKSGMIRSRKAGLIPSAGPQDHGWIYAHRGRAICESSRTPAYFCPALAVSTIRALFLFSESIDTAQLIADVRHVSYRLLR